MADADLIEMDLEEAKKQRDTIKEALAKACEVISMYKAAFLDLEWPDTFTGESKVCRYCYARKEAGHFDNCPYLEKLINLGIRDGEPTTPSPNQSA